MSTYYRDISLYEPKFIENSTVLIQFLNTLFSTRKHSIPFEDFGVDFEDYLFQEPSEINASFLFEDVVRYVEKYLPRVKIDYVNSGIKVEKEEIGVKYRYVLTLKLIVNDKETVNYTSPIYKPS